MKRKEFKFEVRDMNTSSRSHESTFGKNPTGRMGRLRHNKRYPLTVFQKIALAIIVIFLAAGGFMVYKVSALGNKVVETTTKRSVFDQIKLLVNSDQQKLKGESDGRINILLLGYGGEGHPGAELTDSIILVSIDTKTNKVGMLSIPRDLYVKLPTGGFSKINATYAYAEMSKKITPIDAVHQVIEDVTGIGFDYYVRVDFTGFKRVIDDLGGIDVTIDHSFVDYNFNQKFNAGVEHMDGARALFYARGRYITPASLGNDFNRTKKQQQVLFAIRDKFLGSGAVVNLDTINKILNDLANHIHTNMEVWEMKRLYDIVGNIQKDQIVSHTLENLVKGDTVTLGGLPASIQVPKAGIGNYSAIRAIASDMFNDGSTPTNSGTPAQNPNVEVQNGAGVAGIATKASKEIPYTVILTTNAATKSVTDTIIYDYSNGAHPEALAKIEGIFGVSATPLPETTIANKIRKSKSADIVVIVGSAYANKK
jgi:LCP family protein required for cell wall assembly